MTFTDLEIAAHSRWIERLLWSRRRPPLHLRDKIREGQRFDGHAIELFYVRPTFERPGQHHESAIAKVKYVRSWHVWRLYRQRPMANGTAINLVGS